MNIETLIAENTAALKENTAVLREVLAAGGAPTNVTELVKPAKKKAEKVEPVKEETPAQVDPAPEVVETPVPENPVTEETPETQAPAPADPEALIASIIETFKAKMTGAPDAERKGFLKTQLPVLRAKWGLGPDDKLAVLTPTPEKLVGLLADIEAL